MPRRSRAAAAQGRVRLLENLSPTQILTSLHGPAACVAARRAARRSGFRSATSAPAASPSTTTRLSVRSNHFHRRRREDAGRLHVDHRLAFLLEQHLAWKMLHAREGFAGDDARAVIPGVSAGRAP